MGVIYFDIIKKKKKESESTHILLYIYRRKKMIWERSDKKWDMNWIKYNKSLVTREKMDYFLTLFNNDTMYYYFLFHIHYDVIVIKKIPNIYL